jgi:hypothetical protein
MFTVIAPCGAVLSAAPSPAGTTPLGGDEGVIASVDRGDTVGRESATGLVTGERDPLAPQAVRIAAVEMPASTIETCLRFI